MPNIQTTQLHSSLPHFAAFSPISYTISLSGWSAAYLSLNYRIECQIHDGAGTEYATFFIRPNSDGTVDPFRIDSFLASRFDLLDLPDLTTTTSDMYDGYWYLFKLKFREVYTGTTGSWTEDANNYYCYSSALPRGDQYGSELVEYAASSVAVQKNWMTAFENPRQTVGSTFGMTIIWHGSDSTTCTLRQSTDNPALGSVTSNDTSVTLNKGLNYINIPNYGLTTTEYYCWLETDVEGIDEAVTEYKVIKQVAACSQESTQVSWINTLGALEFWTFCCKRFEEVTVEDGQIFKGDFTSNAAGDYTDELFLEKTERDTVTVGEKIRNADHAQGIRQVFGSVLVGEINSSEEFLPRLVSRSAWTYRTGNEFGNDFDITLIEPEKYKPHN